MTKYKWNYKELGFNTEEEMLESIERVERRKKMTLFELEQERFNNSQKTLDTEGNIDYKGMEAGARLEHLDRMVESKMYEAQEDAKRLKEQEDIQGIISGLSEHVDKEKKTKAEREFEKAKAKADEALQKKIYDKHLVKTDKQVAEEDSLRNMLKNL